MTFSKNNKFSKGRPAGSKNKKTLLIESIINQYADEALEVVLSIMRNENGDTHQSTRLAAANSILDRLMGKAASGISEQSIEPNDDSKIRELLVSVLTKDELEQYFKITEKLEQAGK